MGVDVGKSRVHVECMMNVDREHVNHNHNHKATKTTTTDNADSTTSHFQRAMAVSGKELSSGRYPGASTPKTEFVDNWTHRATDGSTHQGA